MSSKPLFTAGLAMAMTLTAPIIGKPAYVEAKDLIKRATFIGVVHVDTLYSKYGLNLAQATVVDQYAGAKKSKINFVTSHLSREDTSRAIKGETILLLSEFLSKSDIEQRTNLTAIPKSGLNCIAYGGAGRIPLEKLWFGSDAPFLRIQGNRRDSKWIFVGLTKWPASLGNAKTTVISLSTAKTFINSVRPKF